MRLNVGSGTAQTDADVNCDLYLKDVGHRDGSTITATSLPNFVRCDGQKLPFKTGCFNVVYCFHVIEHVPNPEQLFNELLRVSNAKVVIRCPHKDGSGAHLPSHRNFFGFEWFLTQCNQKQLNCFPHVRSYDSVLPKQSRRYIPEQIKQNKVLNAYLRFARHWLNPNHAVPDAHRPPFEIEVLIRK